MQCNSHERSLNFRSGACPPGLYRSTTKCGVDMSVHVKNWFGRREKFFLIFVSGFIFGAAVAILIIRSM